MYFVPSFKMQYPWNSECSVHSKRKTCNTDISMSLFGLGWSLIKKQQKLFCTWTVSSLARIFVRRYCTQTQKKDIIKLASREVCSAVLEYLSSNVYNMRYSHLDNTTCKELRTTRLTWEVSWSVIFLLHYSIQNRIPYHYTQYS